MATQWGRKETIIWPPHIPVWTYSAVFLTLLCTVFFGWERLIGMTTLQRSYSADYVRSEVGQLFHQHGKYSLLYLDGGKKKPRLALPTDFEDGLTILPDGRTIPVRLSPHATREGYRFWKHGAEQSYLDASMFGWLQPTIFEGKGHLSLYAISLGEGLGVLLIALFFAVPADVKRFKEIKYGRRLKGPVMVTPREFNKVLKTDGLAIKTDDKGLLIRIPKRSEPAHIQVMGDTGVGKTTLLTQMLQQIEDRGELAIVYDPAGEFTQRFYRRDRDDWILNPFDARCSHWTPSSELRSPTEARTIAASLYQPTKDKKGEFFTETPQKVFAHLLKYRPSAEDLVAWLSNEDEIDRRVEGTEMAYMIAKGAEQQRSGVLGSMGLIADSLRLLPTKKQSDGREWSATEWADKRKGWIFLTSSETEQEALRPLHSLWIDLLILRLLTLPTPGQKRAWFVIDELATLQLLPQFHTALTKSRKSNNPIIFGYQGKAQLEVIYGHLAEVMLSQPAIKLIAKTAEPKAAKWASELIGNVEIERVRESIAHGKRAGSSFTMDRQVEPLVMDSEIQGLDDLHAFMKVGNYVSRFAFPHMNAPIIAKAFIARDSDKDAFWLTLPEEEQPPPPPAPPPSGPSEQAGGHGGLHLTPKTKTAPPQAEADEKEAPEAVLTPAFRSSGPGDL